MKNYKIVILGSGGVGKSSLTLQFVENKFDERYNPTIEDQYIKHIEIDGQQCEIEILDTSGTEQFAALRDLYFKDGQGFALVFSLISQATFNDTIELRDQIVREKENLNVPIILVGNKCDLEDERVVSTNQGYNLGKEFNCEYIETSAKLKINVNEIFYSLIRQINNKSSSQKQANHQSGREKSSESCCCSLI